MSAGAHTIHVPARTDRARGRELTEASPRRRELVRLTTFGALGLYGIERWMTLMRSPPVWRLIGLLALALALAGIVPRARRRNRAAADVLGLGLVLAALPVAGLRWHWVVHLKIAVSATRIGNGLQTLPNVLVPYLGSDHGVRLVIVLGAAVLLLGGAAVIAFAPRTFGDGPRAAAALPLLVLAVVPSTLIRPQLPYLQGFVLFALLAGFIWGERLRGDGVATALAVAAVAGVGAALVAPRLDTHRPWIDYRSWTGTLVATHVDTFNWNQTYGPLRWPRTGHQVLTVAARSADYWKAEDLDTFNGQAWVLGEPVTDPVALPRPSDASRGRWTQRVAVSITGMRTVNVIGAGFSSLLTGLEGITVPGSDPGTLVARRELGPGTSYTVASYSPNPSATQLRAVAGRRYPANATVPYRTLSVPESGLGPGTVAEIEFPVWRAGDAFGQQVVHASPYARAYGLARRLARRARTPYDFVVGVKRYLSRGYRYDEHPPAARYPLESFLFTHKVGYCQQFSGAMAMLLRMGGIPARVAAGFTSGGFQNESHTWQVADTDAHAWVEAWFPRYGWVRFDPTPTSAPARGGSAPEPILKSLSGLSGSQTIAAPHREIGGVNATGINPRSVGGGSGLSPWLALPALLVLAALARLGWILLHPVRGTEPLLAELRRAMARTGRPLSDDVTLATLERRFADSPAAAGYLRSLRLARYGAAQAPPTPAQRRALRRQLAFGLGAMGRLRALWALPPRLPVSGGRRAVDRRPPAA